VNSPSRIVQWLVWGGITLVIAVLVAALVRERLGAPQAKPLPVLQPVTSFSLTNHAGGLTTLDSLRGKVWLADIIFTRCPGQCVVMTREMVALQKLLPPRDDLAIVSLTADPAFDTPERLQRFGETHGADLKRWQFLTGTKADLYTLALRGLLLSVDENPSAAETPNLEDMFLHSSRFVLVDRHGRLRGHFNGDGTTPRDTIAAAVQQLLAEP
jgi:protein SCO1/2